MKIENTSSQPSSVRLTPRSRTAGGVQADDKSGELESANVAQLPQRSDDTFDAARVLEIREAILAGRYKIDPERIADGLIAAARDSLPPKE